MSNPKLEIRSPRQIRRSKTETRLWNTHSVLDCGDSSPLLAGSPVADQAKRRSNGSVQTLARTSTLLAFLLAGAACALAQSYSIDWSTIDCGGGTSTGGTYQVTGTIGQPDAGTMSGGNYTLQGGFWGVIAAVQSPGAPLLSIHHTTTNTVAVIWPSPSTGWALQMNTNSVNSVNWSNVTSGIADDGTTKTHIVNPPAGNRYYRLIKP